MNTDHQALPGKQLQLPAGISYTCHNSGVCCRVFDTIPVDPACAEELAGIPKHTIAQECGLREGEEFLANAPQPGEPALVRRKEDGSCICLGKDSLCVIHKIAGAAAKPRVCQDFPYRYVETPGGVFVGLSFACPSVRGNLGAPLADQEAQLTLHYQVAGSVLESQSKPLLNRRVDLEWQEYMDLEQSLLELLDTAVLPLNLRLVACCALINFVQAYELQLQGDHVNLDRHGMPPGTLPEFLEALRKSGYVDLLRVSTRHRKISRRVRHMFLGMFTSFANTLHRNHGRALTVLGVLWQYLLHSSGLGRVRLRPIENSIPHARLRQASLPTSGPAMELIHRYLRHCIQRKDLVLTGNISRRLRMLLLNAALIPWYAEAEAMSHGRPQAVFEDYSEAVFHVERLYGFHSAFYRFFEQNPAFDEIVESFLMKPNYPFLLLG